LGGVDLQVAVDIRKALHAPHGISHFLRPLIELIAIQTLHDELKLGAA
jgi:hypothetical protein